MDRDKRVEVRLWVDFDDGEDGDGGEVGVGGMDDMGVEDEVDGSILGRDVIVGRRRGTTPNAGVVRCS